MKKKNQELEKFKFVLDYKIKELKKQIEPRENDIKAMKEQIQDVSPCSRRNAARFMYCCYSVCLSVRLSVRNLHCAKTVQGIPMVCIEVKNVGSRLSSN